MKTIVLNVMKSYLVLKRLMMKQMLLTLLLSKSMIQDTPRSMESTNCLPWSTSGGSFQVFTEVIIQSSDLHNHNLNPIFLESLFDEDKILEWLTSNRYKQLELGVFMYAIVSLGVTFICYTGLI